MPQHQAAERIYYDEPATLAFTATVTAIREVARVDGRQVWQIALDRTAFYPTSGGQPYDTGLLTATARSGATLDVQITDVEEDDAGEIWHTTHKPLQEGTRVDGRVHAARRQDHMQQHTGQHLLSAVMLRETGMRTVSFHLGAEVSTIDLEGEALTPGQIALVEQAVNEAVFAALPVSLRTVSYDEAQAMLAEGLLRKLPAREGSLRLVEIAALDLNACGGTHVASTAEIGPVLLRGTERVRGAIRLSFVCGRRAIAAAREDFERLAALSGKLSTSPAEVARAVERLQTENKARAKERAMLLGALAGLEAQSLIVQSRVAQSAAGFDAVVMHTVGSGRDLPYAKLLAARLALAVEVRAALIVARETERAHVVLAARPGTLDCAAVLRAAFAAAEASGAGGGRGGGSRELAQGSIPEASLEAVLESVRQLLGV